MKTPWMRKKSGTVDGCVEFTAGILPTAARELAAFAYAISELFGAEQTRQAVEDWMEDRVPGVGLIWHQ